MREVVIVVHCDACAAAFQEETEGASSVSFTVRGEKWKMDLCDDCINSTFSQKARPVKGRRKPKGFTCSCGKSYPTERGLGAHQTRAGHR